MNTNVAMSYVMIVTLLLVALACVLFDSAGDWLPGNRRFVMAGVMVVYAGVRWYRLRAYQKKLSNEQE